MKFNDYRDVYYAFLGLKAMSDVAWGIGFKIGTWTKPKGKRR